MSAEVRTINLAASGTPRYETAGQYFEVTESVYPVSVDLYGPDGNLTDTLVGIESGFFVECDYRAFVVRNGANPQTIKVLIMDSRRGGSRRTPGTVNVVDQSAALTVGGTQFMGGAVIDVSAGQYGAWTLRPLGARLAVRSLLISSAVAGDIWVASTSGGASGVISPVVDMATGLTSKRLTSAGGGGGGGMVTFNGSLLSPQYGAILGSAMLAFKLSLQAGVPFQLRLETPIVIESGAQLVVLGMLAGRTFSVFVEAET